ncbi:MAG: hypoxanthine phosphoribosyltransferase [Candidatus Ancillula sp.]|jgi:hypoxanthine phosphoribosyltransferase|nr:hypoxanthine phosphoribosyltransferase [Candidatus Ancillula sp.]
MEYEDVGNQITEILVTAEEIDMRLSELADDVSEYYKDTKTRTGNNLLLLGVLKGATYVMADFSRKLSIESEIDLMCLSSYGSGTKSSGVIRVLKDINIDIKDRDVLIVEDIIDSGITLGWLVNNLTNRGAKSINILSLLQKKLSNTQTDTRVKARWLGFEIENKFVVGYGLDFNERYRTLPFIGVLSPDQYKKV